MQSIYSLVPNPEVLLNLEPEELGGIVLQCLNAGSTSEQSHFHSSHLTARESLTDYPRGYQDKIIYALMEAWTWLKREGLLSSTPTNNGGWVFITRRGRKLENADAVEAYRKANLLPKELLHPIMVDQVWPLFLRGNYDTAVFQAFKEIEIATRDAGEYTKEDCDVELMKKAFHPENGKLRNINQTEDEKQATLALFAGAMGLYKNSPCHRNINFTAEEAAETIIFANRLFKIVESSTSASTTP